MLAHPGSNPATAECFSSLWHKVEGKKWSESSYMILHFHVGKKNQVLAVLSVGLSLYKCKYGSIPLNVIVPSVPIPGDALPKMDTSMGEGHIDPD